MFVKKKRTDTKSKQKGKKKKKTFCRLRRSCDSTTDSNAVFYTHLLLLSFSSFIRHCQKKAEPIKKEC